MGARCTSRGCASPSKEPCLPSSPLAPPGAEVADEAPELTLAPPGAQSDEAPELALAPPGAQAADEAAELTLAPPGAEVADEAPELALDLPCRRGARKRRTCAV